MQAASKVRATFKLQQKSLTLSQIKQQHPDLKQSEISMALCYLMRQKYLTRQQVPADKTKGRKVIWCYTYHETRLGK